LKEVEWMNTQASPIDLRIPCRLHCVNENSLTTAEFSFSSLFFGKKSPMFTGKKQHFRGNLALFPTITHFPNPANCKALVNRLQSLR